MIEKLIETSSESETVIAADCRDNGRFVRWFRPRKLGCYPSTFSMSAKSEPVPAPADIQAQYNRFKNELQAIASKIGELENDIEEHE